MRSKSFLVHVSTDGIANRLNPLSKILILLVMNILIFFTYNRVLIGLYFIISLVFLFLCGVPLKSVKTYGAGIGFMVIICFLTYTMLNRVPGNLIWQWGIFQVTDSSLIQGTVLAVRVASLAIVMITYMCITNQQEIIMGLRELRLPYTVCFLVALAFRFAAIFPEDINLIIEAQKARGVNFHKGGLFKRIRSWAAIGLPVIVTYLNHVQRFSNALECHGYKVGQSRNFFQLVHYALPDYLAMSGLGALVTIHILLTF